jgi:cell division protease FtsH
MVTRWGMSDALGMVQLAPRQNPYLGSIPGYDARPPVSEDTARAIDTEVRRIIQESHDEGIRLLREHRAELDALARALLERETLDQEEILEVTGLPPAPDLRSVAPATHDGKGADGGARVALVPEVGVEPALGVNRTGF